MDAFGFWCFSPQYPTELVFKILKIQSEWGFQNKRGRWMRTKIRPFTFLCAILFHEEQFANGSLTGWVESKWFCKDTFPLDVFLMLFEYSVAVGASLHSALPQGKSGWFKGFLKLGHELKCWTAWSRVTGLTMHMRVLIRNGYKCEVWNC